MSTCIDTASVVITTSITSSFTVNYTGANSDQLFNSGSYVVAQAYDSSSVAISGCTFNWTIVDKYDHWGGHTNTLPVLDSSTTPTKFTLGDLNSEVPF